MGAVYSCVTMRLKKKATDTKTTDPDSINLEDFSYL